MAKGPSEKFKSSEKGGKGKSLSKSAVQKVMSAAQSARDKDVKDASFSDLAKLEKQTQVKYDRGADLQRYVDKQAMYQDAINKGATTFVGDDGIERLNLSGTGIKDEQGRTVLSMFKPYITAMPPTGKQLLGDMGRALFSGYNTLSYDPNAVGTPSTTGGIISRVPGLVPNLFNKAMEGKVGITGAVKGLWDKVRGYFSPSQTPQGIETQFPRVSPEARGYFGGYNQGIPSAVQLPPDFQMKQKPEPLTPSQMSEEQFKESYPEYYDSNNTLGNIFLNSQGYDVPISNDSRVENQSGITNTTPMINNQYLAQAATNPYARLYGLVKNPQLNTPYGNFTLDNALGGNATLGYSNTFDLFGNDLNLNATIGNQGANVGATYQFKKGGSIDKYAGLGYKFK